MINVHHDPDDDKKPPVSPEWAPKHLLVLVAIVFGAALLCVGTTVLGAVVLIK